VHDFADSWKENLTVFAFLDDDMVEAAFEVEGTVFALF
jgi:hypothetical protein